MVISSPLVRYISHKNNLYEFFHSWDQPGTSYYLSEYAVNIQNSTKMAELHFDSTPPFSLQA